ncbi:MAG: hypothetical protein JWR63_2022 [Conexibacter sp.]|nr:hypothetical protein [Conexibacter sp.]
MKAEEGSVWRTTRERADATIRRLVGQGFTEGTDEDGRIVLSKPDDTALEGGRRWLIIELED